MKNKKGQRGVITILVSLLLVGILSVGTLVIEAGRLQAAKTQMAESNISAATSMIAAYDAQLYAQYGLLAIDTERFTVQRAMEYVSFNADQAAGYQGNRISRMYQVETVELTGLYNLTYPGVLKRQILSRAKYHVVPQDYALNIYTMDAFFADFQAKCQYVADQLQPVVDGIAETGSKSDIPEDVWLALAVLGGVFDDVARYDSEGNITLSGSTVSLLPSVTGTVENDIPQEDMDSIHASLSDATSVLGGEGAVLSYMNGTAANELDVSVSVDGVAQIQEALEDLSVKNVKAVATRTRQMALAMNAAVQALSNEDESNLLLNSYIAEYFSSRNYQVEGYAGPEPGAKVQGAMENGTFAMACVEYVFGGSASERTNQEAAFTYVQAIRLINNLYAVMSDSDNFDPYNAYSVTAHLAWANYESLLDVVLMTEYGVSVPMNKDQLLLPMESAADVENAFHTRNNAKQDLLKGLKTLGIYDGKAFVISGDNAYSYRDSLALALWFVPNTQKLLRVADLIQLEMRYREAHVENGTATFLMSEQNTYCRIKCTGKLVTVLPIISLGAADTDQGISFQSVRYAGY